MAYIIKVSSRFKKDFKRCIKRGLDMSLITQVMNTLAETGTLPHNIVLINFLEIWKEYGNVIYSQIG